MHLPRRRTRVRHALSLATLALVTLSLVGPLAGTSQATALADAAAAARPSGPGSLTPRAEDAGLTRAGGGEMGWRDATTESPAPRRLGAQAAPDGGVDGLDVSHYQGAVNWSGYYSQGKRFAYVKATEGTYYTSDTFSSQYNGSYNAGFIRGSYHFANPKSTSGAAQARYFVSHGGGWSADGKTLPGVLDIEYNPYDGGTCYGLSASSMVAWIRDFTTTYRSLTGRDAVIYTTTDWWSTCTGNSSAFSATNPLWIARYASAPGTLPSGWGFYTFWQYTSSPLDQNSFNGTAARLKALALG